MIEYIVDEISNEETELKDDKKKIFFSAEKNWTSFNDLVK